MKIPPICLTIAGSDPTAGAGLQADLKTFAYHQCYGMSITTCSTAQTHEKIYDVLPFPAEHVAAQLKHLLETYDVAAIKIGMLASVDVLLTVKEILMREAKCPIVIDPILKASSGDPLASQDLARHYTESLLPIANVITPNTDEQLNLFCNVASTPAPSLAQRLAVMSDYAKSNQLSILAKGGHEQDSGTGLIIDQLITPTQRREFSHKRITTTNDHGTGCALASAIAANLALGLSVELAVEKAENYLHSILSRSRHFVIPKQKDGARNLPMNHFA